jgi:enoyl-[acyl-carrier-protein] reductase (NADH)
METEVPLHALENKMALVVGIANDQSIAYGCAKAFRELGAELAITFLNEKAKPYVAPLADELDASIFMPMDAAKAVNWKLSSTVSPVSGDNWTSWCTPSPLPPERICRVDC